MSVIMKYDYQTHLWREKKYVCQEDFASLTLIQLLKMWEIKAFFMWKYVDGNVNRFLQYLHGAQLKLVHQNNGMHKTKVPRYMRKTNTEKKVSK